jgi:molybdopterin synthase catalytic subunit
VSFTISVQAQDFEVGYEYAELIAGDTTAGAVVFFVGRVRDMNHARKVSGMSLEHYPGMTENILQKMLGEAKKRWELTAARIVHRVGDLGVGDQIVFVGATSAHREHAFQAAEFLMDFLKTQAPFWKKEMTGQGAVWVDENGKDIEAIKKWTP